jgi:hypothetical protein
MAVGFIDFSTKHTVAESTNLLATHYGDHIYNIKLSANRDNGVIVGKGAYQGDDIYAEGAASNSFAGKIIEKAANGGYVVEVTAAADGDLLVLQVPTSPYEFESEARAERQFYNKANDVVRAYQLRYGDKFTLSAEGFTTTPAAASIGKAVSVDATTKKLVIAS